jgi:dolichol-phosphate mannosyltransferase
MIKIIFCALDEAQNLKKFLTDISHEIQILGEDFEIIACLDGSKDDSFSIVSDFGRFYPLKILPLKNERGLGLSFKRIFLDVIKNSKDDDLIISLDADNTHNPEQISEMVRHFQNNNLDLLVASRFCENSLMLKFPLHRQLISRSISFLFQNLFSIKTIRGNKLQDFTSGYRIYRAKKLSELFSKKGLNFITEPEFTYTCELLIKLSRLNCRIDEIAISYDYEKKLGSSKLRLLRNFWRLNILLFKLMKR